jgi:CRISPR system Cascade subunit CasC
MGERTQRLGEQVEAHLLSQDVAPDKARSVARDVADLFGKLKSEKDKKPTYIEQLAFISPDEKAEAFALAERAVAGQAIDQKKAGVLRHADTAVDIAMFGRMLADDPAYNREAAVLVAHAITTHRAQVEDDYYTAVDDLKKPSEDAGAGFVGEAGFGAGIFYLYACIDRDLLIRNLDGDAALASAGITALVEAAATVSPKGKQASFASRARASYLMAEKGETTPRTIASAFTRPIDGNDMLEESIRALRLCRDRFARAYGDDTACHEWDLVADLGTLADVVAFASA